MPVMYFREPVMGFLQLVYIYMLAMFVGRLGYCDKFVIGAK